MAQILASYLHIHLTNKLRYNTVFDVESSAESDLYLESSFHCETSLVVLSSLSTEIIPSIYFGCFLPFMQSVIAIISEPEQIKVTPCQPNNFHTGPKATDDTLPPPIQNKI